MFLCLHVQYDLLIIVLLLLFTLINSLVLIIFSAMLCIMDILLMTANIFFVYLAW